MKRKYAWLVSLIALVIALPVRIYQQLMLVDETTGFFTDHNVTAVVISVLLAIGAVYPAIACRLDREAAVDTGFYRDIPTGILTLITAVMLVVDSLRKLMEVTSGEEEALAAGMAAVAPHPLLYSLLAILGFAAAVILFIAGISWIWGVQLLRSAPVATLLPPLWCCMGLIVLFVKFTEVINTTENVYQMFSVIFLLLFLSAQSKLLVGIDGERNTRLVFAWGLPAVLVGLVTSVPNLVVPMLGLERYSDLWSDSLVLLCFSLSVLSYLACLRKRLADAL